MLPHDPMGNANSRILGDNEDPHSIRWNARTKSQGNSWLRVSQGEVRIGSDISGNFEINLNLPKNQNDQQEEGQEMDTPDVEESSILGRGDDGRHHLSTPSGADQEGSRRRR